MKAELLRVPDLGFSKVSYVTVKFGGKDYSEYEDFYRRMGNKRKDRLQRDEINRRIGKIGDTYGAQEQFFEREESAEDYRVLNRRLLASGGRTRLGVCLCCIRLSEHLVVLLNGDRRTSNRIAECPICGPHFDLAGRVSKAIYDAERMGLIEITGNNILTQKCFTLQL